jgi:hypothetical protein
MDVVYLLPRQVNLHKYVTVARRHVLKTHSRYLGTTNFEKSILKVVPKHVLDVALPQQSFEITI